ncbi:E3 ubiquitin-protein ligase listerin [Abrus precatorius]|uniref:E3 ubiquitin-protein ligase listerin n=1 Tax=Abrus precatorius TaxID=3816 RepID=A0A8B8JLR3_ABRPR|nr:E3 ubiquitin-protein ligase listerin [Abrus precatorius]
MGRQKGEGARSKSRPSSSSLAASLLPSGSAAAVGFGGFVGSSRLDPPPSSEDSLSFADVDSEIAVHLKRLGRKDPTTKLKALAALSMLVQQKSAKEIVLIVPQWAFEYKRLLLDYNREVRRATHDTMTALVTSVGRDLAPHLKALMGPWWFAQFDPVSEVSQAAKRSLQAAFPAQEKRLDALILCTTEIFMYLEENLKLTPQNLSDKAAATDELEEIYQQVISSTLLALATLLDVLICLQQERPGFENINAEPKHASKARVAAVSYAEKLFKDHKYFLDFLKSQRPIIRSATYSVLKSLIKNMPQAINDGNIKTLAGAILGAFNEKDPTCHPSMWDVIILFSRGFPDAWSSLNVQKSILNPFWNFLRNGCFGSQQVSYPALVLFLDNVPPKFIGGDKFFLEFFQNLWAGKQISLSADRLAFFQALKECFLWSLKNASRYNDGEDAISHFRVALVDSVLVKLLWQDFLTTGSSKDNVIVNSGKATDSSEENVSHNKKVDMLNTKYPMPYLQELGKCFVEVLLGIYILDINLLSVFIVELEDNCMCILQQAGNVEVVERIILFMLLLEQHAVMKGATWPMAYIVGPMLAKSFSIIRSSDSPGTVRLMSVAVSIFGPQKMVQEVFIKNKGHYSSQFLYDGDKVVEAEDFMQIFKNIFVPWCLQSNSCSTNARLDLLLALLDDEYFSEQWSFIINYVINQSYSEFQPGLLDADNAAMLAMLIEKARDESMKRRVGDDSSYRQGTNAEDWCNEYLESSAIAVSRSLLPFSTSHVQFVCSLLGGSTEGRSMSFLSRNAMILIYKEIFRKLLSFIQVSPFFWVQNAASMLSNGEKMCVEFDSSLNVVEIAQFALEILDGSFFSLKTLDGESGLVSGILSAIFVIEWECNLCKALDDSLDDKSMTQIKARLTFGEYACALCNKINVQFLKSLCLDSRKRLLNILIQSVRFAIFAEDRLINDRITSLCCTWVLEVLECVCVDKNEEQNLLHHLLSKGEMWPVFVVPNFSMTKVSGHLNFVALIDKLISKIGMDRVFAGCEMPDPSMLEISHEVASSACLAAEMLCTWRWPGSSAVSSFLPLLSAYAKRSNSPQESLLDEILGILLDGSLVYGDYGTKYSVSMWPVPSEEVEVIDEPFLRALVSFLSTLFKEKIWGAKKALNLIELLVNKLFIGEAVNTKCLKVLPLLINVLLEPLYGDAEPSIVVQHCSLEERFVQNIMIDWLERALCLPPLVTWKTGEDMEDWLQLVIACYPFSAIGGPQALKPARSISSDERKLLYELFQKQRNVAGGSAMINQLTLVQMLLSKLMVVSVGYCWNEFSVEDWDFLLSNLRCWIQSAVVMMEDVAENVNGLVNSSSDNLNMMCQKIEKIILISDPFPIKISENALLSFSLLLKHCKRQQAEERDNLNTFKSEKLDSVKDRILEGVLRFLFCTGISEAIANACGKDAASIVALSRIEYTHFWELVAFGVVNSSSQARHRAVKSVEFWGLSKGSISSLYAILFTSKPIPLLQFAAYFILSNEPVLSVAIVEDNACNSDTYAASDLDISRLEMSIAEKVHLKEEISFMVERAPYEVLEMDLLAHQRVNVFLAWSLLISHLWSLPSSSSQRERLIQYIQDSATPVILDCLFQHIPVENSMIQSLKKKDADISGGLSEAGSAATRATTTGSLVFSVESLWHVESEKISSLAGAIYGLMLQVLPAYVRGWFSDLRDRNTSAVIESFTRTCCSPPLIANELSLIKKANFRDENFSVSVSKSANEIVATYTKDETGMDLVIRLPASYPLRPVDVDCTRSLGISEIKQRKWLMSMMLFVRNQNGALAEAIGIWKRNFDKEFEGVEECPICYSVIHTTNHSLPRLACKTCKHKFHSACLYKWFSTSHKSSCPLCQSPF